MENSYHNRDFEHFVKQNADQYRMFPSEKVWKNIHYNLHRKNRWYGFGLALLLLSTATVTWVMLTPPTKNQQIADRLPVASANIKLPQASTGPVTNIIAPVNPRIQASRSEVFDAEPQNQNLFMSDMSDQPEEVKIVVAKELAPAAISMSRPIIFTTVTSVPPASTQPTPSVILNTTPVFAKAPEPEESKPGIQVETVDELLPSETDLITGEEQESEEKTVETIIQSNDYPLTIESVLNTYKRKKSKFSLQAYFAPTISYRKLKEDNQFLSETQSRGTPSNSMVTISDVENIVTHKPDYGLQIGVNAGYEISPRLTFTTGLQFNVNKYDIRAYNYPSERTSIALMSGTFSPSSVETETTYRNYSGGKKADWLHNLYFSASVPIGLQMRLSGAGKTEIGVGGTFQPTYVLGNRTYLLTTDYKNYVEVPSLIRKWNMTTSFEVYAGYSTGKIDWRIGPQVRYQLFSSYKPEYPLKEHLFDFGLKVGIILNK